MEPTDKPSLISRLRSRRAVNEPIVDFLPDADEIERRPLPRSAGVTLHLLAAALLVFLLLATFSEVDLMVTARGRLITPLPNIVVQPLDTAIIQEINVKSGQIVKKGERLATLDPTFTGADESEPHGSSPTKSAILSRFTALPLMCNRPLRISTVSPGNPMTRLM